MSTLTFNRAALQELDRRAVEEFHIPLLVLMENAGRAVAHAALKLLKPHASVLLVCGPGNNGGDGLVAARHLHNANIPLEILLTAPLSHFKEAAAAQVAIVEAMKLPLQIISDDHAEVRNWVVDSQPHDLIIDAIFGTGLTREVTGLPRAIIHALNVSRRNILSIDLPSGLDCDTGLPWGDAIHATETVSFCGHKPGFTNPQAQPYLGKITTADIGAPRDLLAALAL